MKTFLESLNKIFELDKYKIDPKFVGDYANRLKDFPKRDVYNMSLEIIKDLEGLYDNPKTFEKVYTIKTDNPNLKGYEFEISVIPSNSGTGMDATDVGGSKIKLLKPDSMMGKNQGYRMNSFVELTKEITNLLMHEAGHIYLQKHSGRKGDISYYQGDGFDDKQYFWDPEEVVLHSYAVWRRVRNFVKNKGNGENILDYEPDRIKRLISREVANIPRYANAEGIPFPKSLQNKYVAYIIKNIVKPKQKDRGDG